MATRTQPLKDHWKEQRLFLSRVIGAAVVVVLLTGVLIWRLVDLQVVQFERFQARSNDNRFRIQAIPPTRGLIYDRDGDILATNVPTWQLVVVPEDIEDLESVLAGLEELSLVDPADREVLIERVLSSRRFERVTLTNLNEVQAATFAVRRHRFQGVDIQAGLIRHYPYGEATAHVVGYVGSISANDLERIDRRDYDGTSQIGKTGVERHYEDQLHGSPGVRQFVVNAQGRRLGEEVQGGVVDPEWPTPGQHVRLSIDIDLQRAAHEALGERRGAAVAIDPRSGEVLTLVSTPAFDPNDFASGLSGAQFAELNTDSDLPLFNRALAGRYPPGSTVKPFVGLAGLHFESEHIGEDHFCAGEFRLPNSSRVYGEGRRVLPHGETTLHSAIVRSCNVYFFGLAVDLGIDQIEQFMKSFGFGDTTGIDISGENSGLMPGREWKRDYFSTREQQTWYPGETVNTGIGQGYTEVTPLQLAHATATLAARGLRYRPQLLREIEDAQTGSRQQLEPELLAELVDVDPAHWQEIHDAMLGVTAELRGTAREPMLGTLYSVAGKTGTAQVIGRPQEDETLEDGEEEEIEERFRDNGLFIAFAPVENPEIAIAVVVENNGGGSRTAAPVARTVLDTYFGGRDYVAQLVAF